MATNKTVSFRLPDEIINAIEEHAKATGKTKTDLFVEALCQVYGMPEPDSASLTIASVQQQLDGLKAQIESLKQLTHSSQSQFREQTLEVFSALRQVLPPAKEEYILAAAPGEVGGKRPDLTPEQPHEPSTELSSELVAQHRGAVEPGPHISLLDTWSINEPDQLAAQVQYQMQVFDKVFSAIPELVFICDRLGRYTYVSPFGMSVWGIQRDDIIGKKYQEVDLPPEFLDFNLSQFDMVLSFAKLSSAEIQVSSSSSTRYYDYTLSPIQDDEGIVIGIVGIILDITQRKQAELSLQDSLDRYRTLFEMANDMIFIVDAETHQII
ncbi:MAG: PAS domain S-box protein, partial [Leptolyngbyaceae bacterium]|nr:PAS domain S-box protein [Leptolyngbyaceae bacterium]